VLRLRRDRCVSCTPTRSVRGFVETPRFRPPARKVLRMAEFTDGTRRGHHALRPTRAAIVMQSELVVVRARLCPAITHIGKELSANARRTRPLRDRIRRGYRGGDR